jgi:hypothetical protein
MTSPTLIRLSLTKPVSSCPMRAGCGQPARRRLTATGSPRAKAGRCPCCHHGEKQTWSSGSSCIDRLVRAIEAASSGPDRQWLETRRAEAPAPVQQATAKHADERVGATRQSLRTQVVHRRRVSHKLRRGFWNTQRVVPFRRRSQQRLLHPFPAGFRKRMKGLEPSTFCMARVGGRSRPFARVRSNRLFAAASDRPSERQRTRANAECSHCSHCDRCNFQADG